MAGIPDSGDGGGGPAASAPGSASPSVDERKELFRRAVFDLTREARADVRERGEFDAVLGRGRPVNNRLHLVVVAIMAVLALGVGEGLGAGPSGVLTLLAVPGVYALFWLFLAATGGEELERVSVDESGKIGRVRFGRDVETRGDFLRVAIPIAVIAVAAWIAVGLSHDIAFPPPPNCNAPSAEAPGRCLVLPNLNVLSRATAQLPPSSASPAVTPASSTNPSATASPPAEITGALSVEDTKLAERLVRSLQLIAALAFLLSFLWFLHRMLTGRWVGFIRPVHYRKGE